MKSGRWEDESTLVGSGLLQWVEQVTPMVGASYSRGWSKTLLPPLGKNLIVRTGGLSPRAHVLFLLKTIHIFLFCTCSLLTKQITASFAASARKVRIRLRPSTVMTCRLSHSIIIQLPWPVDPSRSMNLNDLSLLMCFWTAVTDIPILFAISLLVT